MRRTMFVVPVDLVPVLQAASADALAIAQHAATTNSSCAGGIDDPDRCAGPGTRRSRSLAATGRGHRRPTVGRRAVAAYPGPDRRRKGLRGHHQHHHLGAARPRGRRPDRARPATGFLDQQPVAVVADAGAGYPPGIETDPGPDRPRRTRSAVGCAPSVRPPLAGSAVVDRLDGGPRSRGRWPTSGRSRWISTAPPACSCPMISNRSAEPAPWVALLPALDATAMGWSERSWYLGEHKAFLFDRNGNVGPDHLVRWPDRRGLGPTRGRRGGLPLAGGHRHRRPRRGGGRSRWPSREWLGPVRFTPRFRTPLERELVSA